MENKTPLDSYMARQTTLLGYNVLNKPAKLANNEIKETALAWADLVFGKCPDQQGAECNQALL